MQPYTPIVPFDVLSQRLGIPAEQLIKLDANENLYGPSPRAIEVLAGSRELHIYPDPDQSALRAAIAAYIGVDAKHILCGAGGDEIIDLVGRAVLQPGDAVIDMPPTFGMYRWEADILNARYVTVARKLDFSLDIGAIERTVAETPNARLLFVANPNNPDGSVTAAVDLKRLLALPLLVVLDEAYIDFSDQPSCATWVTAHPNLIVLRTFSKLAGMAGLRVGYGVFPEAIIKHLWKVKQPYTPNVAGTVAAITALSDTHWLAENVAAITAERTRLTGLLSATGWLAPLPSQTNFVLTRVLKDIPGDGPRGLRVKRALEKHGVLVRYFDKDGLRDCIRISIGKPEHSDALLRALTAVSC